jgi:hypothetical protein
MLQVKLKTHRLEIVFDGDADTVIASVVKLIHHLDPNASISSSAPVSMSETSQNRTSVLRPTGVVNADAIVDVFREVGRPLNASEIYKIMVSRGTMAPNEAGDTSYLRQVMRNDPQQRFAKTSTKKNALWTLKEWSLNRWTSDGYGTPSIFNDEAESQGVDRRDDDADESNT